MKKRETVGVFGISKVVDPARNEDWIKTAKNRASEAALAEQLARDHGVQFEPLDADEDAE
mgnify:CR=1 FL=1